ncbi:MAG: mycofactocin biosynthesis peptidyl-dipeptidase MftE [Actinomycetota bacterium]|nr:mycofactocin biosynthesis peptidyl-dipeptidase MftE [Actinomycetota bacterium]
MSWPDVEALVGRLVLIVPIGSCEQHGLHLPLHTDTVIATDLAERLAAGDEAFVVAPAVAVTASGEHWGFPGTLSIGAEAMTHLVVELVRSADWAEGVVLVNGHGGNRTAVERAAATLRSEGRRLLPWWPQVPRGDAHAGHTETSLMLAIAPGDVRMSAAVAGVTTPVGDLADRLRTEGVRAVDANGVLGDPTSASAAEGVELMASLTADLVGAVDAWRRS